MSDFVRSVFDLFRKNGHPGDEEFRIERETMVARQIADRGLRDERVLAAFRKVPRHRFVPPAQTHLAHRDQPLPIGCGQTISQPYMVALMTSLLAPLPGDKILEIGTGSGYQAAILAELAGEVHTVERHDELSAGARAVLGELGYANIRFHVGDGSLGWPDAAPYDGILVTAGSPQVPPSLRRQLADRGRLIIPVGPFREQRLHVVTRRGLAYEDYPSCPCVFVKLYGAEGWTPQESD